MSRICYIGNFRPPWSTETYVAASLEDLGHTVTRLQEDELKTPELRSEGLINDLVLWTRTWPGMILKMDIEWLKEHNVRTAAFHIDYYIGLPRQNSLDWEPFWRVDNVFTVDGDPKHAEIFKQKGINHHWLPPAIYKKDVKKGVIKPEYQHDIIFCGGAERYPARDWPYRMKLINWLRENYGERFVEYPGDGPRIWGDDLNSLYSSAKIVMGDNMCFGFTQQNTFGDRLFETPGRGGFMIYPKIPGAEKMLEPTKEMVYYDFDDFQQLRGLIDYYLAEDHTRELIVERAMKRIKKEHTYQNRMEKLLEIACA